MSFWLLVRMPLRTACVLGTAVRSFVISSDLLVPHGGCRVATTVGRRLPARELDLVVVDDPVLPDQINKPAKLKAISEGFEAEVI
jgi:hypothetical protein